jgi:hypothetical protein
MNMKRMFRLGVLAVMAVILLLATIVPCQAQLGVGYDDEGGLDFFSGKGKAATTNASYFVCNARYKPARVEFINVASDAALGRLKFYHADNSITVTQALAVGLTNILLSSTNTLVVGDLVCIQSVGANTPSQDKYQLAAIHLVTANGIILTNTFSGALTATCPTDFALVSGDAVWRLTEAGSIAVNFATNSLPSGGSQAVYTFPEGRPGVVLAHVTAGGSTNVTEIRAISGRYLKP